MTHEEQFKRIIRFMPIVITTTALSISFSQMFTFFMMQSNIMEIILFATLSIIVIPIYVCIIIPILRKYTRHDRSITSLHRIGIGLRISIFAMTSAALVEKKHLNHPNPKTMTFLWLAPQIFLTGRAKVFTYVDQFEFFYGVITRDEEYHHCHLYEPIWGWLSSKHYTC